MSLSGLPVGSVDRLHFATDPGATHIVVEVAVDAGVASRIRTDTRATIRTLGLLGDKYIELVPGTEPAADAIPAGGVIPSVDPTDYEAIMGQSGDILENVLETTSALKDVLQTIQRGEGLLGAMVQNKEFGKTTMDDLQRTLANFRQTSASLDRVLHGVDEGEGLVGKVLRDKKLAASLERSIQNLDRVTTRLDRGEGAAMRLVNDREYGDRVLTKLDRASADLADVAAKLNQGTGTLGKLINDSKLSDETRGLVHEVRTSWLVRLYPAHAGSGRSRRRSRRPRGSRDGPLSAVQHAVPPAGALAARAQPELSLHPLPPRLRARRGSRSARARGGRRRLHHVRRRR